VSYGNHKIRAAPNAKIPTKSPGIRAISIITSWIDGGFDYGFLWSVDLGAPLPLALIPQAPV